MVSAVGVGPLLKVARMNEVRAGHHSHRAVAFRGGVEVPLRNDAIRVQVMRRPGSDILVERLLTAAGKRVSQRDSRAEEKRSAQDVGSRRQQTRVPKARCPSPRSRRGRGSTVLHC